MGLIYLHVPFVPGLLILHHQNLENKLVLLLLFAFYRLLPCHLRRKGRTIDIPATTISAADDSSRRLAIRSLLDGGKNGFNNTVFSLNASQVERILFLAAAISAVSAFREQPPLLQLKSCERQALSKGLIAGPSHDPE
jgi:hypothetical protein